MQAFVVLRTRLAQERALLWNQYLTALLDVQAAALQQWQQQNAAQLRA